MRYIYILLILLAISITACVPALRQDNGEFFTLTPVPGTPLPTNTQFINYQPTIDYSLTQVAYAQQTADTSLVISIQATDNHEQREADFLAIQQENIRLTSQSNQWTVTAAFTSIPLTATQQAVINTQISDYNTQQAFQSTQVAEAPKKLIEMTNAQNLKKYSFIEFLLRYTVFFSFAFILIALGVFLIRRPKIVEKVVIEKHIEQQFIYPQKEEEAVVTIEEKIHTPFPAKSKLVFPCTKEQLDELARKVIIEGMSLAYDNFMGNESLFTRELYSPVYSFLLANRLAISTGVKNKGIILTDKSFGPMNGRDVLEGWLNSRELPDGWTVQPTPETDPPLSPGDPKRTQVPSMGQLVPVGRVPVGGESGS